MLRPGEALCCPNSSLTKCDSIVCAHTHTHTHIEHTLHDYLFRLLCWRYCCRPCECLAASLLPFPHTLVFEPLQWPQHCPTLPLPLFVLLAVGGRGHSACSREEGPLSMQQGGGPTQHAAGGRGHSACSRGEGPLSMQQGGGATRHAAGGRAHSACSRGEGPLSMQQGGGATQHAAGGRAHSACSRGRGHSACSRGEGPLSMQQGGGATQHALPHTSLSLRDRPLTVRGQV